MTTNIQNKTGVLNAAVSIDVDTLASIYKGFGCTRPTGYTYIELRSGLENMSRFFEKYPIKTTLFFVGNDFLHFPNQASLKAIIKQGHEPANHSMTHPQGFRWLSQEDKAREISTMGEVCTSVTGKAPVGFRSPGWNMDDASLAILKSLKYRYDSSVFPTSFMPIMKLAHWASMSGQPAPNRTTMGMWRYMTAPLMPYLTCQSSFAKPGSGGLAEFPVSVTPVLRIPFFATLLLFTGFRFYQNLYRTMQHARMPIHFQMHLSDFVDYSMPELQDQMPAAGKGSYVPQALATPLSKKLDIFRGMIDLIAKDYRFLTLGEWETQIRAEA